MMSIEKLLFVLWEKTSIRQILMILLPAMAVLVAVMVSAYVHEIDVSTLTKDVSAIGKIHPLYGFLSSLGILLWCVAAATCAFAAAVLRSNGARNGARKDYPFLAFSAVLTTYLLLDDLFLVHEFLARDYLGLNEGVVYALIGVAAAVYAIHFKDILLQSNLILFLLAVGFLGLSVFIDIVLDPWLKRIGHWRFLVEDGAKWVGIVFWCSYYLDTAYQKVTQLTGRGQRDS